MESIPQVHASLGSRELEAVAGVFASGWPAGQGPMGALAERSLVERFGVAHAVTVSSCAAALHLALLALRVQPGEEVIVADYTFPAPALAVRYVGAVPRFADVRADTGTVDPQAVEALVTSRTVGVIAVDTLGVPADYDELQKIADKHGIFLIEDAACAAGSTYRGRPGGVLAEIACLSFHGRKGATCGEGGALLCADSQVAADSRLLSSFGIGSIFDLGKSDGLPIPEFTTVGYNFKLSDIAAAVLGVQLSRLDELLSRREVSAGRYSELLADDELIAIPQVPPDRTHAWQSYAVTLDPAVDRRGVASELRRQGIGCGHGAWASHLQPAFTAEEHCETSAFLFRHNLAIPMHAELTSSQIERVAVALQAAVQNNRTSTA